MKKETKDKIAGGWIIMAILCTTSFILTKCAENGYLLHLIAIIVFIAMTNWSIKQISKPDDEVDM